MVSLVIPSMAPFPCSSKLNKSVIDFSEEGIALTVGAAGAVAFGVDAILSLVPKEQALY